MVASSASRASVVDRTVLQAEGAVPPGRLRWREGDHARVVRTFLSPTAWRVLCRSGALSGMETQHEEFRRPYTWMSEQVSLRLGAPAGAWPVWVWVRTTRAALISEARNYLRTKPGTVLATCRVPDARLLISDFFDWSCVLLPEPVWPDGEDFVEAELDQWHRDLERACPNHAQLWPDRWPEPFRSQTLASWQTMFLTDRRPRGSVLQGCVAELRADDVVQAVRLGSGHRPDCSPCAGSGEP